MIIFKDKLLVFPDRSSVVMVNISRNMRSVYKMEVSMLGLCCEMRYI
jgi:hypothetical protein